MKKNFSQVATVNHPRSSFDRSHGIKTTFDADYLIPIYFDEALPGDTFNLKMDAFARFATLEFPIMDNVYLNTYFFAVPNRLLQTNWVKLMGEQTDPGDSIDFMTPITAATNFASLTLYDYLSIPTLVAGCAPVNLHARAYNDIWNHWFRDQNLQDSVVVDRDDGPDSPADYVLLKRGKAFDYFTSGLPSAQKGTAITMPLGTSAPVVGEAAPMIVTRALTGLAQAGNNRNLWDSASVANLTALATGSGFNITADPAETTVFADLSAAIAPSVNDMRYAIVIQQILEQDARGGTRYPEMNFAHFGVRNPDSRMQWPEYLGGGRSFVHFHPVANTTGEATGPVQGSLSAFGTAKIDGHGFFKSFTEHCVILGLACVSADLTYQQGLHRMYSRRTRFDFWFPEFAHLGEQATLNQEILFQGVPGTGATQDQGAHSYQERGAEYRYKPSVITGLFRSNHPQSLDVWHLSQEFANIAAASLNSDFIELNTPVDRVIAVPTEPHMILEGYCHLITARCMPMYSTPGLRRL